MTSKNSYRSSYSKQDAGQHGQQLKASAQRAHTFEVCHVIEVYPKTQTYDVSGESGGVYRDVPRLLTSPGETVTLPRGCSVIVQTAGTRKFIAGCLNVGSRVEDSEETHNNSLTDIDGFGAGDPTISASNGANYRAPNDVKDVIPGDWAKQAASGNLLAVLEGGVNLLKSSSLSQIQTHQVNSLVRIICENYEHITSMGQMKVVNDEGKTSLVWRAGSDQINETGVGRERWTFRLDVGHTGNLFNFEVTTPTGQTLARIHIDPEGRLELFGAAGVDTTSGGTGTTREDLAGDQVKNLEGDKTVSIGGSKTQTIEGRKSQTISQNDAKTVGNDYSRSINRNKTVNVGGKHEETITGSTGIVPLPTATGTAKEVKVLGGHYTVDLSPITTGNITLDTNFALQTFDGDISFNTIGGNIVLGTLATDSVLLGANVVPGVTSPIPTAAIAPFTAILFEPMEILLKQFFSLFDAHVHGTAWGPSTPPIVPIAAILEALLKLCPSNRVKIGL